MKRLLGYYMEYPIINASNMVKIYTDDFETFYYEDGTIIPVETIKQFMYSLLTNESGYSYVINKTEVVPEIDDEKSEFVCKYLGARIFWTTAIFGYGNDEESALKNAKENVKILKEKFKRDVEEVASIIETYIETTKRIKEWRDNLLE